MTPNRTTTDFSSWLRAAFAQGSDKSTDGALLERFVRERDEGAFAILVKRHGPMVLGVCRRVLGNATDADDAFQATFLVLVKKARSLRGRSVIGDWLHGVARRTALKARSAAVRRRTVERQVTKADANIDEMRNDWLPKLDEEVSRLPEKYRLPIVLCDLEGRTRREAARQLGWPEGTVAGRQARGRELLAKRLLRGAQAVAGMASAGIISGTTHAALPTSLVYATIQSASAVAAGAGAVQGIASSAVLSLTKGVVQAMFWSKVKAVCVVLVATGVLAGVGGKTYQMVAEGGTPIALDRGTGSDVVSVVVEEKKQDKPNREVTKARNEFETRLKEFAETKVGPEKVLDANAAVLNAELKTVEKNTPDMAFHLANADRLEQITKAGEVRFQAKTLTFDQENRIRNKVNDAIVQVVMSAGYRPMQPDKQTPELDKQLFEVASVHWDGRVKEFLAGKITIDFVLEASNLLLKSDLRLASQKANKINAYLAHLDRLRLVETVAKKKYDAGTISIGQVSLNTYHRLEAEIMLDEARRGK